MISSLAYSGQLSLLESITTSGSLSPQKQSQDPTGQKCTSYCFSCKTHLPCNHFSKNRSRQDGLARQCKSCLAKYYAMRKLHKLPHGQLCQSCGEEPAKVWDHDHKTMEHRGWLCNRCNLALGHAKESIERLGNLIRYLSTHVDATQNQIEDSVSKEAV